MYGYDGEFWTLPKPKYLCATGLLSASILSTIEMIMMMNPDR